MKVQGPFPMRRRPAHFGDFTSDLTVYGNDAANIAASGIDNLKTLYGNVLDFAGREASNALNLNLDALARDPVNFVSGAANQAADFVTQQGALGVQAAGDAAAVDADVVQSAFSDVLWAGAIIIGGIAAFYYFRD